MCRLFDSERLYNVLTYGEKLSCCDVMVLSTCLCYFFLHFTFLCWLLTSLVICSNGGSDWSAVVGLLNIPLLYANQETDGGSCLQVACQRSSMGPIETCLGYLADISV